jgi:hypothetical protein
MEQGRDLGRAAADVLVRLDRRPADRPPAAAGMRDGLERPGLVLAPGRPAGRARRPARSTFFAAASSSVTGTAPPCRRRRTTVPVAHQVRPRCQIRPASRSVRQIVQVLTVGSPSSARRKAPRSVPRLHVAVPSRSRSGARAASARTRRCRASA